MDRSKVASSLSLGVAAALAATPVAAAQQSSPAQPSPDDPAGYVYQIPVEGGRADAAPRDKGSSSNSGEQRIRSENGLGTSSNVPGVQSTGGASGATPPAEGGAAAPQGGSGSGDASGSGRNGSGNGSGGRGDGGSAGGDSASSGGNAASAGTAATGTQQVDLTRGETSDGPSSGLTYVLLVLAFLVPVGLAVLSRRRRTLA